MSTGKFAILSLSIVTIVFLLSQTSLARQGENGVILPKVSLEEGRITMAFYAADSPIGSCEGTLDYLPSSSVYAESPWDMSFRSVSNSSSDSSLPREQMIDLNGDGLIDYQYVYIRDLSDSGGAFTYRSCVYLNTGSGFNPVHRCLATIDESDGVVTSQTYYGDCAG